VILVDAGPLVAVVDSDDQHHPVCTVALNTIRQQMGTVWPVLAKAMYFLIDLPSAQNAVWKMLECGALRLLPLGLPDVPRIRELMQKYSDLPMDLADAALVRVAERENIREFFTIDRTDFSVYRLYDRIRPRMIP